MKKTILLLLLTCCTCIGTSLYTCADDLDLVMKQFHKEQEKLRDMRLSSASKEEVLAQTTKVKALRLKVSTLQAQIGQ